MKPKKHKPKPQQSPAKPKKGGEQRPHPTGTSRAKGSSAKTVKRRESVSVKTAKGTRKVVAPGGDTSPSTGATKFVGKVRPVTKKLWYVVSVEPHMDGRVVKEIRRRKKIEFMEKDIGKIYSPIYTEEVTGPKAGEVVAEGKEMLPNEALEAARAKAWSIHGGERLDDRVDPPELRCRIFPAKSKTKGKVGNGWAWVVRKEHSTEERKKIVRRRRFPGYVIVNMVMTGDTYHLVRKVKGVMGILPQVNDPEEWQAIPLETEEGALLLLEQIAANKAAQQKGVKLKYTVGDAVTITGGAFSGLNGKITKISDTPLNPEVTVEVTILGKTVPVQIKHRQLERI